MKVKLVLEELIEDTDAKKREEKLKRIADSKQLEELAKELYGTDYVRELLIRELYRTYDEKAESTY